jgi:hypothetical protein
MRKTHRKNSKSVSHGEARSVSNCVNNLICSCCIVINSAYFISRKLEELKTIIWPITPLYADADSA